MALLLAATGVYSVLSQAVAKRTQEIGIRMALGAEPQRVVRLMLGSAITPLAAGIVAGATGADVWRAFPVDAALRRQTARSARLCRGYARHRRSSRCSQVTFPRDARHASIRCWRYEMDSDGSGTRDAGIQRAAFGFRPRPGFRIPTVKSLRPPHHEVRLAGEVGTQARKQMCASGTLDQREVSTAARTGSRCRPQGSSPRGPLNARPFRHARSAPPGSHGGSGRRRGRWVLAR